MQDHIFLQILNMSFTGSIVILLVLLARLLLAKAPRRFSYALWAAVLFRLVCPFSMESVFSLLPVNANPIPMDIGYQAVPKIETGIPAVNHAVNAILPPAAISGSVNELQIWTFVGYHLWLIGLSALLLYSLIGLFRFSRTLKGAVSLGGNLYGAKNIRTPFVLGIFRPRIYLPSELSEHERPYLVLHEQTHIKRGDHLFKIVGFLVLCVHWFNPLVWLAFFLFGRDMEMSCDEAVIKRLGNEVKKDYSASLLSLATGRRLVGGTPLAFGEGDTKSRIRHVLRYKKPAFWVTAVAVALVLAAVVGLLVNPPKSAFAQNIIYTAKPTDARKSELIERYEVDITSGIFETKVRLDDSFKSYCYYVEQYENGKLTAVPVLNYGNLKTRSGSIVTSLDVNKDESGRWMGIEWVNGFLDGGGYSTYPEIPFPSGFVPTGFGSTILANEATDDPYTMIPEQPVIIGYFAFQEQNPSVSIYDCVYLMDHPEALAENECMYVVKCIFSQKDEAELYQAIATLGQLNGVPSVWKEFL